MHLNLDNQILQSRDILHQLYQRRLLCRLLMLSKYAKIIEHTMSFYR